MKRCKGLLGLMLWLGLVYCAGAATLHVDINSTNPVSPYSTWETAATNIQDAVSAANSGDTVSVTDGHYLLSSEILVAKNITIQSVNGPDVTLVDGGGKNRGFNLGDTGSLLSGLTIKNGFETEWETGFGGGIYCSGNTPVITNCTIIGNSARRGGGMNGGTARNCTISDNVSSQGGGMYGGTAIDCTIKDNTAYDSGGGMAEGTANNCTITGNSAHFSGNDIRGGGGIHRSIANNCTISGNYAPTGAGIDGSTANNCTISDNIGNGIENYSTATNCIIAGNTGNGLGYVSKAYHCTISGNLNGGMHGGTAYYCMIIGNSTRRDGGGMYQSTAFNCTIRGNSAGLDGGGMSQSSAYNCAILDNVAHGNGGGMHESNAKNCTITGNTALAGGGASGRRFRSGIDNCIVWSNTADLGANLYDVDVSFSCSPDVEHGVDGNITNAPLLISASHISSQSPCRGAGDSTYSTEVDLNGESWLDPPSMGCDEIHSAVTGAIHLAISGPVKIRVGRGAKYVADISGAITGTRLDFGDGIILTNAILPTTRSWSTPGDYDLILTAFNDDFPGGVSFTQCVEVVSAEASTIHVSDATGSDDNDGLSWSTARKSIQSGVDAQEAYGGVVLVSNGTYVVDSEIRVNKDITIRSLAGPAVTRVDGGGYSRCFNLGISACLIDGFTIANGYATDNGGGIYCGNNVPCITNCTVRGNTVSGIDYWDTLNGGGMYSGTANNCIFTGNSATRGGGMYMSTANNCSVFHNSASERGGGFYDGMANNCTIFDNSAGDGGGGVSYGSANNCIIWHNTSSFGENLYSADASFSCSPDVEHGVDGNITNAPLLISAFHIATNSPCREAGNPSYATGTDFGGEAWLNPPSMGCDEIHSEVTGTVHLAIYGPVKIRVGMEAKYVADIRGAITGYRLDFGDGTVLTNAILPTTHAWNIPGVYDMILTAFNDEFPNGISFARKVEVVSSTGSAIRVSDATGDDANEGRSWSTAKKSIQAGVDAQDVYGGMVLVSNGTYVVESEVVANKAVTIQSLNGPEVTIVDGGGNNRCFYLGDKACSLSGLTITNGNTYTFYPWGNFYGSANGGGVYCRYGDSCLTNCTVRGNSAYDGGGVYNGTANNCRISGNSAQYRGGGIYSGTANHSTISGNSASLGGGTYEGAANNCTIIGNPADSHGGGVYRGTANNCTISDNSAGSSGGGMYYGTANNCTISGNSNGDIYSSTANFSFISGDPLFVDAANGDFTLQSNSPCINAGNNAYVVGTTDIAGEARIVYGVVDIGAHEYSGPVQGIPDFDGDGLADTWEGLFFGSTTEGPTGNADGDGSSNGDEYITGTDPTNAASYFHVTTETASTNSMQPFIINWEAVTGRVYNVYWTPSLDQDFQPLEIGIQYPQSSYTDTVHSAESAGYYRVVVMRVDYDADGDGLPNDWESQYAVADAFADADNDGFNNLAEFISGTDPTNKASFFAAANSVAEVDGNTYFIVEWISIPDRQYSIKGSQDLSSGFQTLETGIEHPQNSYTDTVHSVEASGYYKVDVKLK